MDRNRLPKDDPRIGNPMYPGNRLVTAISVLEAPSAGKLLFIFGFPISKGIFPKQFLNHENKQITVFADIQEGQRYGHLLESQYFQKKEMEYYGTIFSETKIQI